MHIRTLGVNHVVDVNQIKAFNDVFSSATCPRCVGPDRVSDPALRGHRLHTDARNRVAPVGVVTTKTENRSLPSGEVRAWEVEFDSAKDGTQHVMFFRVYDEVSTKPIPRPLGGHTLPEEGCRLSD